MTLSFPLAPCLRAACIWLEAISFTISLQSTIRRRNRITVKKGAMVNRLTTLGLMSAKAAAAAPDVRAEFVSMAGD
jgi:hypothetical protein